MVGKEEIFQFSEIGGQCSEYLMFTISETVDFVSMSSILLLESRIVTIRRSLCR